MRVIVWNKLTVEDAGLRDYVCVDIARDEDDHRVIHAVVEAGEWNERPWDVWKGFTTRIILNERLHPADLAQVLGAPEYRPLLERIVRGHYVATSAVTFESWGHLDDDAQDAVAELARRLESDPRIRRVQALSLEDVVGESPLDYFGLTPESPRHVVERAALDAILEAADQARAGNVVTVWDREYLPQRVAGHLRDLQEAARKETA